MRAAIAVAAAATDTDHDADANVDTTKTTSTLQTVLPRSCDREVGEVGEVYLS